MKNAALVSFLFVLPLSLTFAWADDAHHPEKAKKPAATTPEKGQPMQMGMMQDNMLRMHEQMHKIMDAKTPEERERLMQEHSKMMQDNMQMMQGMMGGKMGGGMKGMNGM